MTKDDIQEFIDDYPKSKNISNGEVLYSNNNRLDTNNILRFY